VSKDRYRKVRKALRDIENYIHWVEATYPNRQQRRRVLFEGEELKRLHTKLHEAKRHV
jgi:hypothetical protein